jgi:hypothetical protein
MRAHRLGSDVAPSGLNGEDEKFAMSVPGAGAPGFTISPRRGFSLTLWDRLDSRDSR